MMMMRMMMMMLVMVHNVFDGGRSGGSWASGVVAYTAVYLGIYIGTYRTSRRWSFALLLCFLLPLEFANRCPNQGPTDSGHDDWKLEKAELLIWLLGPLSRLLQPKRV
jgi:hypothetical protein